MALSLDGTPQSGAQAGGTTIVTPTLSTSVGFGNVVAVVATNAASIVSVTGSGLTFGVRLSIGPTSGPAILATYVAPYTSNISTAITATVGTSAVYGQMIVFAIGGSATSSQFDPGVGIPASSTNGTSTITTGNANDFVFSSNGLSTSTGTQGAGWTLIASAGFLLCEYQIVSSTGSFTGTDGGAATNASIIDAIVQGAFIAPDPGTIGRSGLIRVARPGWRWT